MWFDSWNDVLRILLVGAAGYASLVLLLRLSGKRTLGQLNAFDFVVTVALGSTLSTLVLDNRTSLVDGLAALWLLVLLQFAVARTTTRLPRTRRLLTSAPTVLVRDGEMDRMAMSRHRVTVDELHQGVRASGSGDLSLVAAVVLETNGKFSVISTDRAGGLDLLPD